MTAEIGYGRRVGNIGLRRFDIYWILLLLHFYFIYM